MLKKTLFILGWIMLGLVLVAPQPLPAVSGGQHGAEQEYTGESSADRIQVKNVSSHGSAAATHETTASPGGKATHPSPPAASGSNARHGAHEGGRAEVKAIPVKLADAATMDILRTDWLKEAHAAETKFEDSGLSATFWIMIAAIAGLAALVAVFMASGIFNRFSLNIKLYAGFGCLIVLAAVLGLSGYLYLSSVNRLGHLESQMLELDMMSGEAFVAQDEFLLHGVENKAYGERQVEKIKEVLAGFSKLIDSIYQTAQLDAGAVKNLEKIEKDIESYNHEFQEVVTAFHEVEADKETLDEMAESTDEVLEEMIHHHEAELSRLEAEGAGMEAIAYQSRLISHLVEAEVQSLKLTHNEVEFMLDKHADRIPAMEQELGLLKGYLKALKTELRSAAEQNRLAALEKEVENYTGMLTRVIRDEAVIMKNTAEMRGLLHDIDSAGLAMAKQAEHKADGMEREADTALVILIAAVLILGLVLSTVIARGISNPINRIIAGLNEGGEQVASAAGQVSQSSQSLAEGASEQAASIEETSSSLEEMSSMTQQNAEHAGQADSLMQEANQVVSQANQSMTELTGSMEEISNASEETSKIIKTIDEIAFQTNLLALNAAVEAARAGEAGAGFAVVADEVRNLAMRAADAAKNTADLLEGTVKKVNDGSELVTKTNDAFAEVAASAGKVGELVAEIAAASAEQAQGIDQVNTAVSEMDKVTQSNAANAEESASASEEMSAQAEQMQTMVAELVALVSGSKNGAGNGIGSAARSSSARIPKPVPRPAPISLKQASHDSGKGSPKQFIPLDDDINDF